MPESATQPQSDAPSDTQPAIPEQLLPQEPLPPARPEQLPPEELPPPVRSSWNRSALLLIGGPIAGALLVWFGISTFGSNRTPPPAVVIEQLPSESAPAVEPQPAIEASVESSTEAEQEPALTPEQGAESGPVDPEPRQQPEAPPSATSPAINEVLPTVPQSALDTIRGTVRVSVRVTIDKVGTVVDATAEDGGPSRYFERLAVDASRKWTFTPADSEEQRTMLVKFAFTREGVTARAEPDEERLTPQP